MDFTNVIARHMAFVTLLHRSNRTLSSDVGISVFNDLIELTVLERKQNVCCIHMYVRATSPSLNLAHACLAWLTITYLKSENMADTNTYVIMSKMLQLWRIYVHLVSVDVIIWVKITFITLKAAS